MLLVVGSVIVRVLGQVPLCVRARVCREHQKMSIFSVEFPFTAIVKIAKFSFRALTAADQDDTIDVKTEKDNSDDSDDCSTSDGDDGGVSSEEEQESLPVLTVKEQRPFKLSQLVARQNLEANLLWRSPDLCAPKITAMWKAHAAAVEALHRECDKQEEETRKQWPGRRVRRSSPSPDPINHATRKRARDE